MGIYPLLEDETTYILVIDFDGNGWKDDVNVFRSVCDKIGLTVSIERSRSGNGAHAWFFFANPFLLQMLENWVADCSLTL